MDFLISFVRRNYTHNKRNERLQMTEGIYGRGRKKDTIKVQHFSSRSRETKLRQLKRKTKFAVSWRPAGSSLLAALELVYLPACSSSVETMEQEKICADCWNVVIDVWRGNNARILRRLRINYTGIWFGQVQRWKWFKNGQFTLSTLFGAIFPYKFLGKVLPRGAL